MLLVSELLEDLFNAAFTSLREADREVPGPRRTRLLRAACAAIEVARSEDETEDDSAWRILEVTHDELLLEGRCNTHAWRLEEAARAAS